MPETAPIYDGISFNTQPPEGGWKGLITALPGLFWFQHTAARRRLDGVFVFSAADGHVSTHSRPKAAGFLSSPVFSIVLRFNTQPPEGGWEIMPTSSKMTESFNTQPPEGGWIYQG